METSTMTNAKRVASEITTDTMGVKEGAEMAEISIGMKIDSTITDREGEIKETIKEEGVAQLVSITIEEMLQTDYQVYHLRVRKREFNCY